MTEVKKWLFVISYWFERNGSVVSVHRFKVHRSGLLLFLNIYKFSRTVIVDRVSTYLTVFVFIGFLSGLVN